MVTSRENKNKAMLNLLTCGSVDDGKSSLIGRMLYESDSILLDQLEALEEDSRRFGTLNKKIDFALLLDGLSAEREQGITIDVAYRYFSTKKRKFKIADSPGHIQYTRNMVTAASKSDVALILLDISKGILEQTRRHLFICNLMDIRDIILIFNKMDLVNYDKKIFNNLKIKVQEILKKDFSFETVFYIPISATEGDNIVNKSKKTPWFKGKPLLRYLEQIKIKKESLKKAKFIMPIQFINRPDSTFRGYCGTIADGSVSIGDRLIHRESEKIVHIKNIFFSGKGVKTAYADDSITLEIKEDIEASRGSTFSSINNALEYSDLLKSNLVWLDHKRGYTGREYIFKSSTKTLNSEILEIKNKIDINNYSLEPAKFLSLNEIFSVNISLDEKISFDSFTKNQTLGSFILIDKHNNQTVAAGMIEHSLRRSDNITRENYLVSQKDREALIGHKSKVIWLTGLSGSGKTTIAKELEKFLHAKGIRTFSLDGDNLRKGLNKDLGFSEEDRVENIRRVGEISKILLSSGCVVIAAFISPFTSERNKVRKLFKKDEFIEVHVDAPMKILMKRDPKGLYKKASEGKIPNFTGISSPYEKPLEPEIYIDTHKLSVNESVKKIISSIDFGLN